MSALLARCLSVAGLGATLCLALPGAGFAADTSGAMSLPASAPTSFFRMSWFIPRLAWCSQ